MQCSFLSKREVTERSKETLKLKIIKQPSAVLLVLQYFFTNLFNIKCFLAHNGYTLQTCFLIILSTHFIGSCTSQINLELEYLFIYLFITFQKYYKCHSLFPCQWLWMLSFIFLSSLTLPDSDIIPQNLLYIQRSSSFDSLHDSLESGSALRGLVQSLSAWVTHPPSPAKCFQSTLPFLFHQPN